MVAGYESFAWNGLLNIAFRADSGGVGEQIKSYALILCKNHPLDSFDRFSMRPIRELYRPGYGIRLGGYRCRGRKRETVRPFMLIPQFAGYTFVDGEFLS